MKIITTCTIGDYQKLIDEDVIEQMACELDEIPRDTTIAIYKDDNGDIRADDVSIAYGLGYGKLQDHITKIDFEALFS
jgi:hypothetical protein